ncbi:MAG: bifunctional 4-hydroxy-2-oxoglutarate aldolase/2-dehydro-3-deoxy-phosphogluconate aldolase [Erysipelotrichaceae bacterium]|nr:bifunctional 4-hydroxy-2-oxoglutarate aldolase/2-dehydro-3-deoxy-phosphogluconate aldolase [Erysipelotrichaceae bacterium]
MTINDELRKYGVVPVVVLDDSKDALPLAKALVDGGLPCAEVTFRTSAAKEAIHLIVEEYPDMLVGAGTVLNIEQAKDAINVGAKFIVSPGFDDDLVRYCKENNIPVFPGVVTPTEVMKALKYDLKVLKFFPAENYGGLATIKALSAPFNNIQFMPTGGINSKNIKDYLTNNKIIACGGSWMVKKELINEGKFDVIESLVKEAVSIVKEIRG